jgi:hypothetical protein
VIRRCLLWGFAATLVLGTSAAGVPTWGTPVQLSSGERARGPELALDASGEVLVVWNQEIGADCPKQPAGLACIHVVTSAARERGSTTWSAPVEISRPGVGSTPLSALDPSGNAAIAWIHDIGRDRVLQASYRRASSGSWPEPNDVSEASLEVRTHEIALDAAGNALVVWSERTRQVFDLMAAFRDATTGAWSAPRRLSGFEHGALSGPDLALTPAGRAVVTWVDGQSVVWVAFGDSATRNWESPVALSAAGSSARRGARVAASTSGDVAVVWLEGELSALAATVVARHRARTGEWTAPDEIGTAVSALGGEPQVALDDLSNAVVMWVAPSGVVTAASGGPTQGWSVRDVSRPGAFASAPRLAVDGLGNAVAVWADDVNGPLHATIRPAASQRWQPPARVSQSVWQQYRVAMDRAGNATAVWDRSTSQQVVVEAAQLAGRGPVLEVVAVPRRATVGHLTRFSVRTTPWSAPLAGAPRWRFGDGRSARGLHVAHRYMRAGTFSVRVTSVDASGGATTATRTIRVRRQPSNGA